MTKSFTKKRKLDSKIAHGYVTHKRYSGAKHQFKYNVTMMLLDLRKLNSVFKPFLLWSYNRFNLIAFKRKKYLGCAKENLIDSVKFFLNSETSQREQAQQQYQAVNKVYLLTSMAYLGYCFNPINLYFCYADQHLAAVIAEVSNTPWGEKKIYLLSTSKNPRHSDIYHASFKKTLHVSPFMNMHYDYDFRLKITEKTIIVHIKNKNTLDNKIDFDATLNLRLKSINRKNLAKALLQFPTMSVKTILAIYWQALKIWLKGNKYCKKQDFTGK